VEEGIFLRDWIVADDCFTSHDPIWVGKSPVLCVFNVRGPGVRVSEPS